MFFCMSFQSRTERKLKMERVLLIFLSALVTCTVACQRRGTWKYECGFGKTPRLSRSLPDGKPVYGVQPIGDEIYVIRDSTPYIEVYDRNTLEPTRNITVDGLQGPYDMVQSSQYPSSLFIADWFLGDNLKIVRVPEGNVSTWSFQENGMTTVGLARSNAHTGGNILVTTAVSQKLKKFSVGGNLVEEVTVQNISRPRQAIQVSDDRYAVCYGYGSPPELHRVCLLNADGETIKCYGGIEGSGKGRLKIPSRLELTRKNCILVADMGNKRVVLLNEDLDYIRDLITTGLDGPYRLFLDEKNKLLYVADNTVDSSGIAVSGRVRIFDLS